MKRAVFYARVSTDAQQKEGTIDSQVFELKRQIAAAGHVLVKEYIEDGHTGTLLDRPALNEMRTDVKTDLFDAIYFHSADRIARDVAHQIIIVGELLQYSKKIIIGGKDYEQNPENKLALTMLGAVAEFERSKIIERMKRGKLHRLRTGHVTSHGVCTFGLAYVKKTPTSPPALVVNEKEAEFVRWMFEAYDSGALGFTAISRSLEERGILTRMGKTLWTAGQVRAMLRNHTYAGVRYFNRMTSIKETSDGRRLKRGKCVYRDPAEWIAVKVPAIVSQELFDRVQKRIRQTGQRYRQPDVHYLLSGLITCGGCERGFSSYRRYHKKVLVSGELRVHHKAAYRCNRRSSEGMHDRKRIQRCHNPEVGTHILEGKVFELIREIMLDPRKLRRWLDGAKNDSAIDDRRIARELTRIAGEIKTIADQRRHLITLYASEQMAGEEYINANLALDNDLNRLRREKGDLVKDMRGPAADEAIDLSIRQFSDAARARLDTCVDFESKRQFLVDHIEKVIYLGSKVTIIGTIPVRQDALDSGAAIALKFRIEGDDSIEGQSDKRLERSRSRPPLPYDRRWREWKETLATAPIEDHPLLTPRL